MRFQAMLLSLKSCDVDLEAGGVRDRRTGEVVPLRGKPLLLCRALVQGNGELVASGVLMEKVWGMEVDRNTLDQTVRRLRKRLEINPKSPQNLLGSFNKGFRLIVTLVEEEPADVAPTVSCWGRAADIESLSSVVSTHSLVTVVGPPGVGKSALVQSMRDSRLVGTCWVVDVGQLLTSGELCRALAFTLRRQLVAEATVEGLAESLPTLGDVWIVLDNLESLSTEWMTLLRVWRARAPTITWVVTSRRVLGLSGEAVYKVSPLVLPKEGASDVMDNPCVGLFCEQAALAHSGFRVCEEEQSLLIQILQRTEGIPAAVEMAAARVGVLSLSQIAERMEKPLAFLTRGRRDVSGRRCSLREMVGASWEVLRPWEQAALAQCGVFTGGFDLAAAEAVVDLSDWVMAPSTLDVLHDLVEASLIDSYRVIEDGMPRFRMFEYVRTTALGYFDVTEARRRHAAWFAGKCVERSRDELLSVPTDELAELTRNQANLLSALAFSLQECCHQWVGPLSITALILLEMWGEQPEGLAVAEDAMASDLLSEQDKFEIYRYACGLALGLGKVKKAEALCDDMMVTAKTLETPLFLAISYFNRAIFDQYRGSKSDAETSFLTAIELLDSIPFHRIKINVFIGLSNLNRRWGRLEVSDGYCRQALELSVMHRDSAAESVALMARGLLLEAKGLFVEAEACQKQSVELVRTFGGYKRLALCLSNLGLFYRKVGRHDEALQCFYECVEISKTLKNKHLECRMYGDVALALRANGELERATELYQEVLLQFREAGDRESEGAILLNLSTVLIHRGILSEAERLLKQGLVLYQETGNKLREGQATNNLAYLSRERGDLKASLEYLKISLRLDQAAQNRRSEGTTRANIGVLLRELGELEGAEQWLKEGLAIHHDCGNQQGEGIAYGGLGLVLAMRGDWTQARLKFGRGESHLRGLGAKMELAMLLCEKVEALLLVGKPEEAEVQIIEIETLRDVLGVTTKSRLWERLEQLKSML